MVNGARKGKPGVLVTVPGSPEGPLAKGDVFSRTVYTRWAFLTQREAIGWKRRRVHDARVSCRWGLGKPL